jgi:hypothetical protein
MKKISLHISIAILFIGCFCTKKLVSPVKYNGKYGFIDSKGKWVVNPDYDSLDIFYNGYATSYLNEKEGLINRKGELIVGHKFDFLGLVENGIALVITEDDKINYINLKGQFISKINFNDGGDFGNKLAPIQFSKDGKWGYINSSGEIFIDTIYSYAGEFENGKATVDYGKHHLIINKQGQIIDTIQYINKKRKFELIGNSNSNTLGKINSRGDTIMQMKYKSFGYLQEKYFWFNNGKYYGLADTTGKVISKIEYEYLSYFSDNGLAFAKVQGKYGYINNQCTKVIDFIFQDAKGFKHGLAAVKEQGKWGFINANGGFEIKPIFENIGHHFRAINSKRELMYNFEIE